MEINSVFLMFIVVKISKHGIVTVDSFIECATYTHVLRVTLGKQNNGLSVTLYFIYNQILNDNNTRNILNLNRFIKHVKEELKSYIVLNMNCNTSENVNIIIITLL